MASDRHRRAMTSGAHRAAGGPPRDVRPVVAAGLCIIAAVLVWPLVRGERAPAPADVAPPRAPRPPATVPADGEQPARHARVMAPEEARPAAAPAVPTVPVDEPGEDPGTPTGIAVFPPPGTDPPRPGLIVPDDYELPDGYMRHYQSTDDGKQLPPILMFHPDFQPVDDRGRPIALPEDRVVPRDMAPPGLPLDMLEVPAGQVPLVEHPPKDTADPAS